MTPTSKPKKIVFLVLSEDKVDAARLINEIPTDETCQVENADSFRVVIERILSGGIDGLVINLGTFDLSTLKIIGKLKAFNPALSTIITPSHVFNDALRAAKKMKRVVVLEKPYGPAQLTKFCEKIKQGEEIYQRLHERFPTQQHAMLQRLPTKIEVPGIVHNMSKGGAFIEYEQTAAIGDIFKITMSLDKLGKTHLVYGIIVRVALDYFGKNKRGLALRFMDEREAYLKLTGND